MSPDAGRAESGSPGSGSPELENPGSWSILANLTVAGQPRALGGRLRLEDGRLTFRPHRFDRATGGEGFDVSTSDVASVDSAPRRWGLRGLLDGGVRRRLRIRLADGREMLLVVNRVERRVEELRSLLGIGGSAARD